VERFQVAEAIARAEVVECLTNSNGNGNVKREMRHKGCSKYSSSVESHLLGTYVYPLENPDNPPENEKII